MAVRLNYQTGEMEIRGLLSKEPGSPAPQQVWVWAYFVNPQEAIGGSRSDEAIMVITPFPRGGDTATIVASGPFHWATNADAPKDGYFARVRVSGQSAEDAKVPVRNRDYSTVEMTRVTSVR